MCTFRIHYFCNEATSLLMIVGKLKIHDYNMRDISRIYHLLMRSGLLLMKMCHLYESSESHLPLAKLYLHPLLMRYFIQYYAIWLFLKRKPLYISNWRNICCLCCSWKIYILPFCSPLQYAQQLDFNLTVFCMLLHGMICC